MRSVVSRCRWCSPDVEVGEYHSEDTALAAAAAAPSSLQHRVVGNDLYNYSTLHYLPPTRPPALPGTKTKRRRRPTPLPYSASPLPVAPDTPPTPLPFLRLRERTDRTTSLHHPPSLVYTLSTNLLSLTQPASYRARADTSSASIAVCVLCTGLRTPSALPSAA